MSSAHWAVTSTFSRLIEQLLTFWGLSAVAGSGSADQQVGLAAEAEAEGGVEEGRGQRERRRDQAERGHAEHEPERADQGEPEADALGEPQRRRGFPLVGRPQPRCDQVPVESE